MSLVICEFSRESIKLLAFLVHDFIKDNPKNTIGEETLQALIDNTETVSRNPSEHDETTIPSRRLPDFEIAPNPYTGYSHLMLDVPEF